MSSAVEVTNLTKLFIKRIPKEEADISSGESPSGFFMRLFYYYLSKGVIKVSIKAVDDLSFSVKEGEVFCLLGPNGSGKSTLLKLVAGLYKPTAGRAFIYGRDVSKMSGLERTKYISLIAGVMVSGAWVNPFLTAKRNLGLFARTYGLDEGKIEEAIRIVGLEEYANSKVDTFSSGMLARLVLASGLLKESKVYLMDEPLLGISREVSLEILGYISKLCEDGGATVIYATNSIEEAEKVADRVAVMHKGRILALGEVGELKRLVGGGEVVEVEMSKLNAEALFNKVKLDVMGYGDIYNASFDEIKGIGKVLMKVEDSRLVLSNIIESIVSLGVKISYVRVREPTLEEVFIKLIKGCLP